MSKDNNKIVDQQFLSRSKVIDLSWWAVEFGSSKFLAFTTGILAYSLFDGFLREHFSGSMLTWGRAIGVSLFFLIIDAGLTGLIKYYYTEKHGLKKDDSSPSALMKRNFLRLIFIGIIFRFVATTTSSFWASPEVAHFTTGDFNDELYINEINKLDSLQEARKAQALEFHEQMDRSKSERINKAKRQGAALVKEAIASGDYWQRRSYEKEALAWLNNRANRDQSDKEYAKRILSAQQKAQSLIDAEINATEEAAKAYTIAQQDTTYSNKISFVTKAGEASLLSHQEKERNRTTFFYIFDFIAAFSMLIAVRVRVMRKIAAGDEGSDRNLASTLSRAFDSWYFAFIDFLEGLLMLDVNGDGSIGKSQQVYERIGRSYSPPPSDPVGATAKHETEETEVRRTVIQGFVSGRNTESETTETQQRNTETKQAKTHVAQASRPVSTETKQEREIPKHRRAKQVKQDRETVVIVDSNEKYLRQLCRQNYRRMLKPGATETPAKNYEKFKQQLEFLGYTVTPKEKLNTVWFEKDGKEWT